MTAIIVNGEPVADWETELLADWDDPTTDYDEDEGWMPRAATTELKEMFGGSGYSVVRLTSLTEAGEGEYTDYDYAEDASW